jgi:hypothetical protein
MSTYDVEIDGVVWVRDRRWRSWARARYVARTIARAKGAPPDARVSIVLRLDAGSITYECRVDAL